MSLNQSQHKTGLFLTGGGARGAYQVGVLQAILAILSAHGWPAKKILLILFLALQLAQLMRLRLPVVLIILKKASPVSLRCGDISKSSRFIEPILLV